MRMNLNIALGLLVFAGIAFSAELKDVFFDSTAGFYVAYEQADGSDHYPTMSADVGPEIAGSHLCDFEVQGHSGVADITLAEVEVTDPASGVQTYSATYANGGLVTNPSGTKATLSGITVPADYSKVTVRFWYSDGECYDLTLRD